MSQKRTAIQRIVDFLSSHRLLFTTILIISGCIIPYKMAVYLDNDSIYTMENHYYASQIITSVFVISGVVIAGWQYYLSSRESRRNLKVIQIQKALELCEFYKDQILCYQSALQYIFKNSNMSEILDDVTEQNISEFDIQELHKLFPKAKVEKLKKLQSSPKFIAAVLQADRIYNLKFNITPNIKEIPANNGGKEKRIEVSFDSTEVMVAFTRSLVTKVLNNMEFFAMFFVTEAADESVVYQSLHQSYIQLTLTLYYFIAGFNTDPVDKYYTNLISLYSLWLGKRMKNQNKMNEKARSVLKNGSTVNNV